MFKNFTLEQAKEKGFTHRAKLYGTKGFVKVDNDDTFGDGFEWEAETLIGNYFTEFMIYIDVIFSINKYGFPILLGEKI